MKKLIYIFLFIVHITSIFAATSLDSAEYVYEFNETAGTTITDTGSVGSDGTSQGSPVFNIKGAPQLNGSIGFNGGSDSITNTWQVPSDSWTISLWVNWTTVTTNTYLWGQEDTSPNGLRGYISSGSIACETGNGANFGGPSWTINETGQWHHIVCTYNATTNDINLYVNGALQGTVNRGFNQGAQTFDWAQNSRGSGQLNDAKLDQGIVWESKVLNESERETVFNLRQGCPYPFDNCFAGTAFSAWNVTNAYENATAWNDAPTLTSFVRTNTPTIDFSINVASNVSLCILDLNYTAMLANSSCNQCSSVDTMDHSCTLAGLDNGQLVKGENILYFSLQSDENETSTSGGYSIWLDFNVTGFAPGNATLIATEVTNNISYVATSNITDQYQVFAQTYGNFTVRGIWDNTTDGSQRVLQPHQGVFEFTQ